MGQFEVAAQESTYGSGRVPTMRSNVAPFLWFVAAFIFTVAWRQQHRTAYLLWAVIFAILAVRSYKATKRKAI